MNSVLKILEKHRWLIACTLYLLTISIRLVGITTHPLQTDEHHWVHRSSKVLTLFKSDPLNATTHLGHPGVPAALVMAAGELAGKGWNKILGESTGDYFYLDGFSSTRIANVVFSSLITPLIFLSLSNLFGALPLLVCCLFISLGAYHIFLSRLAHIDTIQTVIVTATIIAFFYSVERQSLLLKLLAGFLWGLAIAIKPTAASLALVFLLYKGARKLLTPAAKRKNIGPVLVWSDVWAIVIGHLTLAAIYTRLWHHYGDYLRRLHIQSFFADFVFDLGSFLQSELALAISILLALAVGTWHFYSRFQKDRSNWHYHLSQVLGLTLLFFAFSTAVPQVFENIFRFWSWVFSLSHVEHVGFAATTSNHPLGYFGLFLSFYPPLAIVGLVACLFKISQRLIKGDRSPAIMFLVILFITIVIWILPLSFSPKQSWRYAMPIVPLLYIASGIGIVELLRSLSKFWPVAFPVGIVLTILISAAEVLSVAPHYELYHSRMGGSFKSALESGIVRPLNGFNEAIDFFMQEANKRKSKIYIFVTGDDLALKNMAYRKYGTAAKALNFGYFPPWAAHYVISTFGLSPPNNGRWNKIVSGSPVLKVSYKDISITRIWEVPAYDSNSPMIINVANMPRETARVKKETNGDRSVVARVGKVRAGAMMFMPYTFRLAPGNYNISTLLTKIKNNKEAAPLSSGVTVSINFGSRCKRHVDASKLVANKVNEINLTCEVKKEDSPTMSVYWHGKVSTLLFGITIRRNNNKSEIPAATSELATPLK